MNKQTLYIILLLCLFSTEIIHSQEKKKIEIEYAGRLTIDEENYPGAKVLTRDESQQVHIMQGSINMWSDKAIYYSGENFIEAYGNVKLIQGDTIHMTSKYIEYSGITQLAFASGDVVLKDPNSTISSDTLYYDRVKQQAFYKNGGTVVKDTSGTITSKIGRYYMEQKKYQFVDDVVLVNKDATINSNYFDFYSDTGYAYLFGPSTIVTAESNTYTEKGFYDTKNKNGYAVRNSKIHYNDRIIEGDSLYFDDTKKFASATNNIKVTDTINHSIAKGHYAEVFKAQDSLFITKRALVATKQENDSIYMHADKIMVTGKPENRIVRAYYNAKIYKSDLSGKADSIHSNQKTGLTQFINLSRLSSTDVFSTKRRPVLWNVENQMTGDTIHLISNPKTEKLDSLLVFNNAFIISKDTISTDGYNQISGIRLVGLFNEKNELRKVDIIKNAQSIFYTRNENQELIGIDKAKSGSISILFSEGDIEEYSRLNQVDGDLYPESKYPEKEKRLKGFDWREDERPLSVEDLFKDDEPLILPTIKGLDDYIPQDTFFDEELLERVKLAGQGFVINKAARNIPEEESSTGNLLEFNQNFNTKEWQKVAIELTSEKVIDPEGKATAFNVIGTGSSDGHTLTVIKKTKGMFKWSIWLKGKGITRIRFQEQGGDYTNYNTLPINLTDKWTKYTLTGEKVDDGNYLRCVISDIQTNDSISLWGSELIELSKK
ncbi:OstA-like protein [Mariniflexile rhizosphaerae]|uniref:OstA-like protein n=1 Tax=unclassified Mariniflexile TaxID=2643887 RepID=UPI000E331FB8|nr:OstA-like protein [Mariniflexile sp. TRM1-10]AXP81965.1 OstA-like protein [Mariniflexile sp. TRM1-10]